MIRLSKILSPRAALAAVVIASTAAAGVAPSRRSARSCEAPAADVPVLVSPPPRESRRTPSVWAGGDSGRTILLPPPGGMLLEFGVCSPWRDRAGRFQVVGRLSGDGVGLARISFPDGEVLDFVETDAIPTGRPCWFPGSRPRVLFAAGDGRLHRCAFDEYEEDEAATSGAEGLSGPRPERPSRIDWPLPDSSMADVFLADPSWLRGDRPDEPLLMVVASREVLGRDAAPANDQIWWIQLDEAGEGVVEAGPLLDSPSLSGGRFLRSPVAGKAADGGIALAYLCTDRPRAGQWDLRTTRLSFDPSGRPLASSSLAAKLAGRCSTDLPPAFSPDGKRVRILQAGGEGRGHLVQVPLPAAVAVTRDFSPVATPLVASRGRGL